MQFTLWILIPTDKENLYTDKIFKRFYKPKAVIGATADVLAFVSEVKCVPPFGSIFTRSLVFWTQILLVLSWFALPIIFPNFKYFYYEIDRTIEIILLPIENMSLMAELRRRYLRWIPSALWASWACNAIRV